MLRYYTYFSIGGYKDLFLGDSESSYESTYYLPLLPILEERAANDTNSEEQLKELKTLPPIKQLSSDDLCGLPSSAKTLFSHAGYKLIYKHLEGQCHALALRNIPQKTKDETGRSIPFLFVITCDSNNDVRMLDILATYFAGNLTKVENYLSETLVMDMAKNGLRFDLAKFNQWTKTIVKSFPSTTLPSLNGGVTVHAGYNKVALILLPEQISKENAMFEQKIDTDDVVAISTSEIISKDNPDKLVDMILALSKELRNEKKRNNLLLKGLIVTTLIGFLIGLIF